MFESSFEGHRVNLRLPSPHKGNLESTCTALSDRIAIPQEHRNTLGAVRVLDIE